MWDLVEPRRREDMTGQRANACGARRDMEVEEHYRYSVLYQQGQQQRQQFKMGYLPPWAQLSRHQRRVASSAGICNETDKYQNQIVAHWIITKTWKKQSNHRGGGISYPRPAAVSSR